jgi:hypothetical protein
MALTQWIIILLLPFAFFRLNSSIALTNQEENY